MSVAETAHHATSHWSVSEWYALAHVAIVASIVVLAGKAGIRSALKGRQADLSKKLVDTKRELKELQKQIETSRLEISQIENTKATLIAGVEDEGRKLKEKLLFEAEATAKRILEDARLAQENELKDVQSKIRHEIVSASIERGLEKLKEDQKNNGELGRQIHKKLVDKFVSDVSRVIHV
jgi:F-type H+-transporting ATPase subunit b